MAQAYTTVLKFNIDGRPYVRDIHDLFSALLIQVKFSSHKYLFTTYENTITSEDIIEVLGHLQFTQAIRIPTISNASNNQSLHYKTTVTTTTFNMNKGVGKALCQQFIWAKLMYNATDPFNRSYRDKSLWKVTPKGLIILNEFCERIEIEHPLLLFTMENITSIDQFKILMLDRNEDDQLILSRSNMTSLFRIMINAISSSVEDDHHGILYKHANKNNNTIVHKVKKKKNNHHYSQKHQQYRKSSYSSEFSTSTNSSMYSGIQHGNHSNRSSMVSSIHSSTLPLSNLSISSSSPNSTPTSDKNNNNNNNNNNGGGGGYFSTILEKFNLYDSTKSNTSSTFSIYKHHHYHNENNFDEESEDDDGPHFDDGDYYDEEDEDDYDDNDDEEEYAVIRRMRVIFTSQYCCDWLGNSCSLISRDEAELLSTQFLKHGWVRFFKEEDNNELEYIESSKHTILSVTPKGRQIVIDGMHSMTSTKSQSQTPINTTPTTPTTPVFNFNETTTPAYSNSQLDDISHHSTPITSPSTYNDYDNTLEQKYHLEKYNHHHQQQQQQQHSSKLMMILKDAQLRSLFKDFLKVNFCEENLDFWIDYHHLKNKYKNKQSTLSKKHQKDLLEDAIAIWAKYLSPKAKHELNIDHDLQQGLKRYVKSIIKFEPTSSSISTNELNSSKLIYISTQSESQSLCTLLKRFDLVEIQICRLMASDSVPKFTTWLLQTFKKNNYENKNNDTSVLKI